MSFSQTSMDRLSTCHPDLRVLFIEVDAMGFECSILCGERGKEAPNITFKEPTMADHIQKRVQL